jgi:predicted nucleotidyltransferase
MNNYLDFIENHKSICNAKKYSLSQLSNLEKELNETLADISEHDYTIITTGSYGREEASAESDLDLFIFCANSDVSEVLKNKQKDIEFIIGRYIEKQVGSTGTFGADAISVFDDILVNIGGQHDTNETLTRRMLFLLEGKAIYRKDLFESYRKSLLGKYIASTSSNSRVDKFLLNDIIRYYRTITTDFQYKVDQDSKAWGLRNIKLRFSRKLLYFAGILAIAESSNDHIDDDKLVFISKLLDTPVLERLYSISIKYSKERDKIPEHLSEIFKKYDDFLECISNNSKRKELESIEKKDDRLNNHTYMALSESSNSFTKELFELLDILYGKDHPIHLSLAF